MALSNQVISDVVLYQHISTISNLKTTKNIGFIEGLEEKKIIKELTAAGLAYGLDQKLHIISANLLLINMTMLLMYLF